MWSLKIFQNKGPAQTGKSNNIFPCFCHLLCGVDLYIRKYDIFSDSSLSQGYFLSWADLYWFKELCHQSP